MENFETKIKYSLDKLEKYLNKTELKGYDPYDALNSPVIKAFAFNSKYLRIAFTQAFRRLPLNFRPILRIHKGLNPKGLGLFLEGYVKLFDLTGNEAYHRKIEEIADLLDDVKSPGFSEKCWGYNFPWQNRHRLLPKWTPTIVNTSFIGRAFLAAYELIGDNRYLDIAKSTCDFILKDLNIVYQTDTEICLSYTPYDKEKVYNANILGAALLAYTYKHTQDEKLIFNAQKMTNFVVNAQKADGSWYYGEGKTQTWIDIHHSGFILESLFDFYMVTKNENLLKTIKKGIEFFENHFFLEDGRTKLWHDKSYPVDIHSVQAIVTLVKLQAINDNTERLEKITSWIIDNMQDESGYFYYRKGRILTNKIPFMRWSQAWSFHALTTYIQFIKKKKILTK